MKRLIKLKLGLLCTMTLFSSCLKKDLPAYPLWENANIDKVYVEHRYNSTAIPPYNGQPVVANQGLAVTQTIDQQTSTINLSVIVPAASAAFPAAERAKVVQNNLWIYFDISTAATLNPEPGTPKPGDPTNLTATQKYTVTAANGTKRTWTINTVTFTK